MSENAVATVIAVVLAAVLVLVYIILIRRRRSISGKLRKIRKIPERRKSRYAKGLKRKGTVIAVMIAATLAGLSADAVYIVNRLSARGERTGKETAEKVEENSEEAYGGAAETWEGKLPGEPVTRVDELTEGYFRLSEVENSEMLSLYGELVPEADEMTMDTFNAAVDELPVYLERLCAFDEFLDYHDDLNDAFPRGDRVEYGFENPDDLEDCLAELRGAGKQLEIHLQRDDTEQAAVDLRHMYIRGKDCLYYGKPLWKKDDADATSERMWAYSEITFTSLVNRKICGGVTDVERIDMYYILGQSFQYLADIADTDEFKQQMYFLAAVCFRCASDEYIRIGGAAYSGEYAAEMFFNELKTVYNIAVTVGGEERNAFFEEMRWAEEHIDPSRALPGRYPQMRREIGDIELYMRWRDENG